MTTLAIHKASTNNFPPGVAASSSGVHFTRHHDDIPHFHAKVQSIYSTATVDFLQRVVLVLSMLGGGGGGDGTRKFPTASQWFQSQHSPSQIWLIHHHHHRWSCFIHCWMKAPLQRPSSFMILQRDKSTKLHRQEPNSPPPLLLHKHRGPVNERCPPHLRHQSKVHHTCPSQSWASQCGRTFGL